MVFVILANNSGSDFIWFFRQLTNIAPKTISIFGDFTIGESYYPGREKEKTSSFAKSRQYCKTSVILLDSLKVIIFVL